MPCLNEEETVGICVKKAIAFLEKLHINGEVIVADNGSTDKSAEIAKGLGARVVFQPEKGYGNAYMKGIQEARGKYIVIGDADDSYDFSNILPFIEKLREGFDLVMGCRLPSGGGTIVPGAMPWKHRWIGNPALSGIGKLLFGCPVSDFHCGMRGFSKEAYERMNMRTTGMEFASEMVINASLKGMRITEIPITLNKDGRSRPPHLRSWRDGWRHLRFMLMYSPTSLFLIPGFVLFFMGLLGFGVLLPGPLRFSSIVLDTNTLLTSALACLIGFQLICFATFAKTFAVIEGFLPEDPRLKRLFSFITLEVGLAIGFGMFLIGLGLFVAALLYWAGRGFGELDYSTGLRLVIPSVTLLALGVQILAASFFMSILGLGRKR